MIPLPTQLSCARRELQLRRSTFPKWVRDGRMTQAKAQEELDGMEAICQTLQKLVWLEEVSNEMRKET